MRKKIVFATTRNRGELTCIVGSTHVLYLEQTIITNYYICQPQRSEEHSFGLTTTSSQSECHEKVFLHPLLKFCTLLKIVPCTQTSVVAGLEKNSCTRCLRILVRLLAFALVTLNRISFTWTKQLISSSPRPLYFQKHLKQEDLSILKPRF